MMLINIIPMFIDIDIMYPITFSVFGPSKNPSSTLTTNWNISEMNIDTTTDNI